MLLRVADGDPDLWKHHGSFYGIDDNGGFQVNTTRAHGGKYDEDGREPNTLGPITGDVRFKVKSGQTFAVVGLDQDGNNPTFQIDVMDGEISLALNDGNTQLRIQEDKITATINGGVDGKLTLDGSDPTKQLKVELGGQSLTLEDSGGQTKLTIGDGSDFVVLWTELNNWWAQQLTTLLAHTHPVPAAGLLSAAPGAPVTGNATAGLSTNLNLQPLASDAMSTKVTVPGP
jgi:hypothetical protein